MKLKNKYYIMRHGEAKSNVRRLCSCRPEKFVNHLTQKGKQAVKVSAIKLKDCNIDLIFCSPLLRTIETAGIVEKVLKIKPKIDLRLREIGFGIYNDKPLEGMWRYFHKEDERINKKIPKGETYKEILERMLGFVKSCEKKYKGKNILVVSHEGPLFLLQGKIMGLSFKETIKKYPPEKRIHKGEFRELN